MTFSIIIVLAIFASFIIVVSELDYREWKKIEAKRREQERNYV